MSFVIFLTLYFGAFSARKCSCRGNVFLFLNNLFWNIKESTDHFIFANFRLFVLRQVCLCVFLSYNISNRLEVFRYLRFFLIEKKTWRFLWLFLLLKKIMFLFIWNAKNIFITYIFFSEYSETFCSFFVHIYYI